MKTPAEWALSTEAVTLEELFRMAINEALEEAAKVCEEAPWNETGTFETAEDIRDLKFQPK